MPTIKHRRGTASEWIATNPILADGELGFERDTNRFKLGDGLHNWTDLDYFIPDDAVSAAIASQVSLVASSVTDLSTRVVALEENPGGGGGGAVHVGPATDNPDPEDFSLWVTPTEVAGIYGLRVSNQEEWFEIAAGGGGGGSTNERPTAAFTYNTHWSTVNFNAGTSNDPDGFIVSYDWDFGDGSAHGSGLTPSHTYAASGSYPVTLTVTDDGGRLHQVVQTLSVIRMYGPITFTTQGATFDPKLWQVADSTNQIEWIAPTTQAILATGPTPSINFGTAGQRQVEMYCSKPQDVLTLNVGYNTGHDTGDYLPGANGGASTGAPGAYNLDPQRVTAITGYRILNNLVNFMAAGNPLDGTLGNHRLSGATDFNGLSKLEFIECAYARVNSTDLTGCTSLIRLCFEENNWQGNTMDLNPVRENLIDLRMANQGGVNFVPLTGPMTKLYHECTRDQPCSNLMGYPNTPAVTELWTWNTNQSGALIVPALIRDIRVQGNNYTSIDFSHTSPSGFQIGHCLLSGNPLTSVIGLSSGQRFGYIEFNNCGMTAALVNGILSSVNSWNTSNGSLYLNGNAAPTNDAANTDLVALRARGWNVVVNTPVDTTAPSPVTSLTATPASTSVTLNWTNPTDGDLTTIVVRRAAGATAPANTSSGTSVSVSGHPTTVSDSGLTASTQYSYGVWAQDAAGNTSTRTSVTVTTSAGAPPTDTLIWEDTFNRADAMGTANVGNDWYGTSPLNIVSNRLQRTNGTYQIHLRDDPVAVIPRSMNVAVEIDIPAGSVGAYLGIAARAVINSGSPLQSGVRAFMNAGSTDFVLGNCVDYNADNVSLTTVASPPAGWGTDAINTFRLELRGNNATILCNGTIVRTGVIPASAQDAVADTAFGICGEGNNRLIDAIRVYSLAS